MTDVLTGSVTRARAILPTIVPSVLIASYLLLTLNGSIIERAPTAVVMAFLVPTAALLAMFLCLTLVTRLAGLTAPHEQHFHSESLWAAVLLFACGWIWAQHVRGQDEARLLNCVEESAAYFHVPTDLRAQVATCYEDMRQNYFDHEQ